MLYIHGCFHVFPHLIINATNTRALVFRPSNPTLLTFLYCKRTQTCLYLFKLFYLPPAKRTFTYFAFCFSLTQSSNMDSHAFGMSSSNVDNVYLLLLPNKHKHLYVINCNNNKTCYFKQFI